MVFSLADDFAMTYAQFEAAVVARWPEAVVTQPADRRFATGNAQIEPADETGWQIDLLGSGQLTSDGDHEQRIEFAEWAADLAPGLIAMDSRTGLACRLRPGMTREEIRSTWTEELGG